MKRKSIIMLIALLLALITVLSTAGCAFIKNNNETPIDNEDPNSKGNTGEDPNKNQNPNLRAALTDADIVRMRSDYARIINENDYEFKLLQEVTNYDFRDYITTTYARRGRRGYVYGKDYGTSVGLSEDDIYSFYEEEHIIYEIEYIAQRYYITGFEITDPDVKFCGLALDSSPEEFAELFESLGFEIPDSDRNKNIISCSDDEYTIHYKRDEPGHITSIHVSREPKYVTEEDENDADWRLTEEDIVRMRADYARIINENNYEFKFLQEVDVDAILREGYIQMPSVESAVYEFYGKNYVTGADITDGGYSYPEEYVGYIAGYHDQKYFITGFEITDPEVEFCGLTVNSSIDEFRTLFESLGFEIDFDRNGILTAIDGDFAIKFDGNRTKQGLPPVIKLYRCFIDQTPIAKGLPCFN